MSGETAFIDKTTGLWRNGEESEVREHNRTGYERRVKNRQDRLARQGEDLRNFLNRLRENRDGDDAADLARLKEQVTCRVELALSRSEHVDGRSKARNKDGHESKADRIVADMISLSTPDLKRVVREWNLHAKSTSTSSPNNSSRGTTDGRSTETTLKAPRSRSRDTRRHTSIQSRPNDRSRGTRHHRHAREKSPEPSSTQSRSNARGREDRRGERGRSPGARELYRTKIDKEEQERAERWSEERSRRRRHEEEDAAARKRFWEDLQRAQERLEERLARRQEESHTELLKLLKAALAR